jgi:adenylate kinase family enzyme
MLTSDLRTGNVVEFVNGRKALLTIEDKFIYLQDGTWECSLSDFHNDLTSVDDDPDYNIIVVYEDYTLKRVLWERDDDKKDKLRQLLKELLEEL